MAQINTLDIAKDIYKAAYDGLNQDSWFLSQVQKSQEGLDGLRAVHNVHLRRSAGVGAQGETDNLPTAGSQGYRRLTVPLRMLAGRVSITVAAQKLLAANDASFVDSASAELEGNRNDLLRDISRQLWGTSNGVIAQCGVTTAATLVVLASTTSSVQMRQLWFDGGMIVDIGTVANPIAIAQARTVTAYDESAKTITISGANVTTSALHFVFRTNSGGASDNSGTALGGGAGTGDGQKELTGMQTHVSNSATLHTLAVATEPQWKSQVFGNGGTGRDPSEHLINNAILKTSIATGTTPEFLVCSEEVHMAVANLFLSLKRNMTQTELKGGYTGIAWSTPGVGSAGGANISSLMADYDCPAGQIFGFSSNSFVWYMHPDGFDWMDADGSMWSRITNKAAYEASMVGFAELATTKRRDMFVIQDVNGVTS